MREIKFRGKCIETGEWVTGNLIGTNAIVGDIVEFNDEYFNTECWYAVDPETVGQYTGLKDKNGTKIYEGDIFTDTAKNTHVITFDEYAYYFQKIHDNWLDKNIFKRNSRTWLSSSFTSGFEVFTNIHDKPELIHE